MYALSESIEKMKYQGSNVYLVADAERKTKLIKLGLTKIIEENHIVESQLRALRLIKKEDQH